MYPLTTTLVPFQPSSNSVHPNISKVHASHDTEAFHLQKNSQLRVFCLGECFSEKFSCSLSDRENGSSEEQPESLRTLPHWDLISIISYVSIYQLQLEKKEIYPVLIVVVAILLHPLWMNLACIPAPAETLKHQHIKRENPCDLLKRGRESSWSNTHSYLRGKKSEHNENRGKEPPQPNKGY